VLKSTASKINLKWGFHSKEDGGKAPDVITTVVGGREGGW
jgi:hypothetical protein